MKKLILLEFALLFLATTFESHNPPGWYQQQLPVNDFINDIFFLDSLNGWVVTDGGQNDTAYIMRTTNGGDNWEINYKTFVQFNTIQFTDSLVGYACGIGSGPELFKSTNGGNNWEILNVLTFTWKSDLAFINRDTGWVTSIDPFDGGLFKTTNGGVSWQRQLNETYKPSKVFFINKDTGWFINSNNNLYHTFNSGNNWSLQYSFQPTLRDLFFIGRDTGWIIKSGINGILKTTNGGFNWSNQIDPDPTGSGLSRLYFTDNKTGYIATAFSKVIKTTNGELWGRQNTPDGFYGTVFFVDSLKGWAGGGPNIIKTTDGGGPITYVGIEQNESFIPSFELHQNYPNPFNPATKIKFELLKNSVLDLTIYDITGKEITKLISGEVYNTIGSYEIDFNSNEYNLSSGVYLYTIKAVTENRKEVFIDTKKMILIR